jgi:ribose-phosphate pyrophosphokinase
MMENGASSVRAMTTHAILSGEAYERIENSKLTELIVTDTIPLRKQSSKIKVLSVADLFADIMKKVTRHESISESFIV